MLQRAIRILETVLFFIAGASLITSIGLAFTAVVLRYIFNYSLEWIEEAARYLALFAAFLVAGPVLRNRGHVALDLLPASLRGGRLEMHRLAVALTAVIVGSVVFIWSIQLVLQTYEFGLMTASLQFPQWLPYSIVPTGMAVLVLFSVSEVVAAIGALRAGASESSGETGNT